LTQDWVAAERSVQRLAELRPVHGRYGHGLPVCGDWVSDELHRFAANFQPPSHGRYVNTPVRSDEYGVLYVPPAPPDPVPMYAAGVGLAAAAGCCSLLPGKAAEKQRGFGAEMSAKTYEKYMRNGYRE
jgi:hypothetical protein